jgi:hypothetical protein
MYAHYSALKLKTIQFGYKLLYSHVCSEFFFLLKLYNQHSHTIRTKVLIEWTQGVTIDDVRNCGVVSNKQVNCPIWWKLDMMICIHWIWRKEFKTASFGQRILLTNDTCSKPWTTFDWRQLITTLYVKQEAFIYVAILYHNLHMVSIHLAVVLIR